MKDFFNLDHPMFRPLWVRLLVVALLLGWALVEIGQGAYFWALIFGASGLYCAWGFFVTFDPDGKG
ncbi:hypothetical protein [Tranquillimonas alkanivorans]|uniref:DUF3329 domain-containing protein n=1 Tax=Tranquillimonas alkanivorans TaxID=441119 RepID=A0A1I5T0I6_9RHOB|nr:hypothetical protein [Tranquillimonas alkanivorans]SFP76545.1 hypothetical protein SAMN04488047_11288 [Tranquillimonas alkanivorans]